EQAKSEPGSALRLFRRSGEYWASKRSAVSVRGGAYIRAAGGRHVRPAASHRGPTNFHLRRQRMGEPDGAHLLPNRFRKHNSSGVLWHLLRPALRQHLADVAAQPANGGRVDFLGRFAFSLATARSSPVRRLWRCIAVSHSCDFPALFERSDGAERFYWRGAAHWEWNY